MIAQIINEDDSTSEDSEIKFNNQTVNNIDGDIKYFIATVSNEHEEMLKEWVKSS